MIRTLFIGGMIALAPVFLIGAEEDKTQPASTSDYEARKASIANMETHIAQREQRLAEWGKDIVELDARIEKRVDELVKMLAGLRDSQDSRTKVSRIKKDAIEALKQGINRYITKRKSVREMVRTGDSSALGDLGKFDLRIIKHVDQIADLTKSIPTHEDTDKYKSENGSYWNGYYSENTRISDDWKQNRRDTVQSDTQRKDTTQTLKKALERLDQRRRSIQELLKTRDITESAKQLYTTELGQVDAYEEHLNAQLRDVTTATGGGGKEIGLDQANDVEQIFEDSRADLREDVSRLFRTYDQFVRGRAYLEGLKKNLEDRKAWLEKNAPSKTSAP